MRMVRMVRVVRVVRMVRMVRMVRPKPFISERVGFIFCGLLKAQQVQFSGS